jgi:hypothetical protein
MHVTASRLSCRHTYVADSPHPLVRKPLPPISSTVTLSSGQLNSLAKRVVAWPSWVTQPTLPAQRNTAAYNRSDIAPSISHPPTRLKRVRWRGPSLATVRIVGARGRRDQVRGFKRVGPECDDAGEGQPREDAAQHGDRNEAQRSATTRGRAARGCQPATGLVGWTSG